MKISRKLLFITIVLLISMPYLCRAQLEGTELSNPLGTTDFAVLAGRIINWVKDIGILLFALMIIWNGILFMQHGGNETELAKAKKGMFWAIAGLCIILIGDGFISIIKDLLGVKGVSGSPASAYYQKLKNIVQYAFWLGFGAGIVLISWGLVDWARYGGDDEKMKAARKKFVWGIIGITLMISINAIISIIAQFIGVSAPTI